MRLVDEVGADLDGLSQLRALIASVRKAGILAALEFDFVQVEAGRAFLQEHQGTTLILHIDDGLIVGLPSQMANDKGRYRQQRAMAISKAQPLLENACVRASRA
jgi:hypothetical protein